MTLQGPLTSPLLFIPCLAENLEPTQMVDVRLSPIRIFCQNFDGVLSSIADPTFLWQKA